MNVYIGLFLVSLIKLERYRFNYGRKWHKDRMNKSKIKLPIDTNGNPDWQFMEDYIKSLPYSSNWFMPMSQKKKDQTQRSRRM